MTPCALRLCFKKKNPAQCFCQMNENHNPEPEKNVSMMKIVFIICYKHKIKNNLYNAKHKTRKCFVLSAYEKMPTLVTLSSLLYLPEHDESYFL